MSPSRPQIQFVLFEEDLQHLAKLQAEVKARTGLKMNRSTMLRLAIRLCPLNKKVNLQAVEIIKDDRRKERGAAREKRFKRVSCMVTNQEQLRLQLIREYIHPLLRPKIKPSALGRLVLRTVDSSLIMVHTSREVFFDDMRRSDTPGSRYYRGEAS